MNHPPNAFKRQLEQGTQAIGIWSMLRSTIAAEIIARSGFDWILIDGEHAPNELPDVIMQLLAVNGGTATPIVRLCNNDTVLFKRYLDAGATSLMVPLVQTVEDARKAVAATRYPPRGVRGVAVMHRGSCFGRITDYVSTVEREICLIVQIETHIALANLEAIATVDGVDALFVGPSDLAASLGYIGQPAHPEVQRQILDAFERSRAVGVPIGVLAPSQELAKRYLDIGFAFVAVGSDLTLLCRESDRLAADFRDPRSGQCEKELTR